MFDQRSISICCEKASAVLLTFSLFLIITQWGGTIWAAPAIVIGLSLISVFLVFSVINLLNKKGLDVRGSLFTPWLLYVFISGVLISVAPWDAWRTIVCQSLGVATYYIVSSNINSLRAKWLGLFGILSVGCVCVVAAYYQAYVDCDWGPFDVRPIEQYKNRMSGFFGQPNGYAAFVMMTMPVPLFYAFIGKRSLMLKVAALLIFLFLQWGVLLGVSRAAIIALNLSFLAYAFLLAKTWKWRLGWLCLLLVLFWGQFTIFSKNQTILGERFDSLVEGEGEVVRKLYYPIAWKMFRDRPITGHGEESFQYKWDSTGQVKRMGEEYNVHSDVLELLAENGLVGGLLYYGPVSLLIIYSLRRSSRLDGSSRGIIGVAIVGLTGFLLHGMVDFLTKYLSVVLVSFIYLAFLGKLLRFRGGKRKCGTLYSVLFVVILMVIVFVGAGPVKAIYLTENNRKEAKELIVRLSRKDSVRFTEFDSIFKTANNALMSDSAHVPAMLQAADILTQKASYDPQNREEYLNLALIYSDQVLSVYDGYWRFWVEKAYVLMQYDGRHEEVMECYARALAIAPENLLLRMNYVMYLKSQEITGAVYDEQAEFVRRTFPGHAAIKDL